MAVTNAIPEMERELRFFPVDNSTPRKLTAAQVRHFNERGYVLPLAVFSTEEAEANRRYFDQLMARARAAGHDSYSINGWHRHCVGIYRLLMEPRILDYVEDLIGANIVSTMTHYFSKEPGDDKQVVWHQDASYWPLTPSKVVTVWLAIDDADVENACMRFIPGSHHFGHLTYQMTEDAEDAVLNQKVLNAEQFGQPVNDELQAGEISLHSDLLLHGSEPNRSDRRRCGLTLRYCAAEVRAGLGWNAKGVVVSGADPTGHWANPPRPERD
jgi:non-haem Fe2+, alpha-ketoglutarate-dependent halogenase